MEFKLSTIPVDQININDTRFKISTGAASAALVESIKHTGVINPPILAAANEEYRIISGFKRIEAWRQTSEEAIPVRILNPEISFERCIHIAIADNSLQRSLNIVEQAHAISLLALHYRDSEKLPFAARMVGLSVNQSMAEKLIKLAEMDQLMKSGVLDGSIALPVALQLYNMPDSESREALAALLRELGLSLNRQRELLEWIISICRRDHIPPIELLATDEIAGSRRNKDLDRRQKAQLIRAYLRERRYPTIVGYERCFDEIVQYLKLANGTSLIPPLHFENPAYCLRFEFRDQKELRDKLQEMEKIVKSDIMQAFWDKMEYQP